MDKLRNISNFMVLLGKVLVNPWSALGSVHKLFSTFAQLGCTKQCKHVSSKQYTGRLVTGPTLEAKAFIELTQESVVRVTLYGQL